MAYSLNLSFREPFLWRAHLLRHHWIISPTLPFWRFCKAPEGDYVSLPQVSSWHFRPSKPSYLVLPCYLLHTKFSPPRGGWLHLRLSSKPAHPFSWDDTLLFLPNDKLFNTSHLVFWPEYVAYVDLPWVCPWRVGRHFKWYVFYQEP